MQGFRLSQAGLYAAPVLVVLAGVGVGIAARVLLGRLQQVARGTKSTLDDLLVVTLRGPVVLWGALIGCYAAIEITVLPFGASRVIRATLLVLAILSVTWVLARLSGAAAERALAGQRTGLPRASLVSNIARLIVVAMGVMIALQTLGIAITPFITALGVGALAVGLALQDTLANFFAGIHILTSRQIRTGDVVRLPSGDEGYVRDVTWRYTTIHQLNDNILIVPNSVLAGATITNYSRPSLELNVSIPLRVASDSDLAHVEQVTLDVAREVTREAAGAVRTFEPYVRYVAFADAGIDLTLVLRAREYRDQQLVRHELIRRLLERFRADGIDVRATPPPPAAAAAPRF
jgi:small-conductance mechanosensitive channel